MTPQSFINQILDISQFVTTFFIVSFILGYLIDKIFSPFDLNTPLFFIFVEVILQLVLLTVVSFTVRRYTKTIPLLFKIDKKYVKNQMGESDFAAALGSAIIFVSIQRNFLGKIFRLKEALDSLC